MKLDGGKIYRNIKEAIGDAGWLLMTIKKLEEQGSHETKERLKVLVNEWFRQGEGRDLITSRHTLDTALAKLEGAGLIYTKEHGRARLYFTTEQGREYIEYMTALAELMESDT